MNDDQTSQPQPTALCASFAALLPLLDGPGIAAAAAARVRAHLSTCPYCQAQRALYTRLDAAVMRYFGPAGPALYQTEDIMRDVLQDQETQKVDSRARRPFIPPPHKPGRTRSILS